MPLADEMVVNVYSTGDQANPSLAVPNASVLIGLALWAQGLVIPQGLPARLTNTVAVTVQ